MTDFNITGTVLHVGSTQVISEKFQKRNLELETGEPAYPQINEFQPGLLSAVLSKGERGEIVRKSGIMAVVKTGGIVKAGDVIQSVYPEKPYLPLERV